LRRSRRTLPIADASVDALSSEHRGWLAASWGGRADAECGASHSFRVIADALRAAGAEAGLIDLAVRAVEDEEHHARICHRMASIYEGQEARQPKAREGAIPAHAGASDEVRRSLHIIGQCCLNETTGSAFYESCLAGATAAPAREALLALLSDEVDHARIGWAHLASPVLSSAVREGISPWLGALIRSNLRAWEDRMRLPDSAALTAHGCPAYAVTSRVVVAALEDLITPGFAHVGYDVREAARLALAQSSYAPATIQLRRAAD